jgi:hypothetical protein
MIADQEELLSLETNMICIISTDRLGHRAATAAAIASDEQPKEPVF